MGVIEVGVSLYLSNLLTLFFLLFRSVTYLNTQEESEFYFLSENASFDVSFLFVYGTNLFFYIFYHVKRKDKKKLKQGFTV